MKSLILLMALVVNSLFSLRVDAKDNSQKLAVMVTDHGFEPKSLSVKPGTDVTLELTRTSELTCATQIQIPSQKVLKDLPLNEKVSIHVGVLKKGELRFGCGMNMMENAKIVVQ